VFFELLDEKLVGFASGDVELDELVVDGFESVVDPVDVGVGVGDFTFDPFSVSSSIFGNLSVSIGNSSEVADSFSPINLLLFPFSVMFFLFFIDGILKFHEKLFNSVYSIRGHGVSHHHFINLGVKGCSISAGNYK